MWFYYNATSIDLVLFNGDKAKLYTWLGFGGEPADTTPPSKPAELAAMVTDGSVTLKWQASTDNVGVDYYKVVRDGVVVNSGVTSTTVTFTGQLPGVYDYGVSALDAAGNTSETATISVTVPGTEPPPGDLAEVLALARENNALLKEIRVIFR